MSLKRLKFAMPYFARQSCCAAGCDARCWTESRAVRAAALTTAGLIFCLGGCRPATLQYEVASSSMAPTFLGPSLQATCQYCSHDFLVAAESYRPEFATRCAQCGGHCQVTGQPLPGQRVNIQPWQPGPEQNQHLWKRFELVAFKDPDSGGLHVKRVWGLPGEQVLFRDGEIYIAPATTTSPQLLQKSLAQLQQLCVPISHFPEDAVSHWYVTAGQPTATTKTSTFSTAHRREADNAALGEHIEEFQAGSGSGGPVLLPAGQQLQWRYQRPAPVHTNSQRSDAVPPSHWLQASPVVDDYEVNQGVSCQLHPVDDILLSLELVLPLNGELRILWRRGELLLPIGFQPPNQDLLASQPATTTDPLLPKPLRFAARQQILVAWCDQRLLVTTDCETAELDATAVEPVLQPIAVHHAAAAGVNWHFQLEASQPLQLNRLQVARDLHFEDWQAATATTAGYFVIGDNLPVSIDSRGRLGRIAPQQIVGRVRPYVVVDEATSPSW